MSILKSMNIGVTGLRASGVAMSVIGDNIANVNTMGFKGSRANFNDLMGNFMLGSGDGVGVGNIQQMFEQGALEMTGSQTDMAIAGPGFFMVKGQVEGQDNTFYTRAGQFGIDKNGFITSGNGFRLQGYQADAEGNINATGQPGDIRVSGVTADPKATSEITLQLNLDANAAAINRAGDPTAVPPVPAAPFDPTNPDTYSYSSSMTMYDSQGNAVQADVYYTKTADNTWEYRVVAGEPPQEVTDPATPGTLGFDADGKLDPATTTIAAINIAGTNGGNAITPTIDFDGTTQFAGANNLRRLSQDGYASGEIRGIQVESDGTITGVFSNGKNLNLGQVAIANFDAPEALVRQGGNLWAATDASGQPKVGIPGTGDRGSIVAGALEGSNVDLAHEFIKLIAAQRGFQANSKTITTGDQMLQEAMNLKR